MAGGFAGGERGLELGDQVAILAGQVGLQLDDARACPGIKPRGPPAGERGLARGLVGLELLEAIEHRGAAAAVGDGVDDVGDLRGQPGELARLGAARPGGLGLVLPARLLILLDERRDDVGIEQVLAQRFQDAGLGLGRGDLLAVRAGAGLVVRGAAVALLVADRHGAAADATDQQAREDPLRTLAPAGALAGELPPARLHRLPEILVDDAQLGRGAAQPIRFRVDARQPPPGLGVLDHADAVPDQLAVIGRGVEDAVGAALVADDGVGAPQAAARRGDAAAVQVMGDRLGALAGGIAAEDLAHDLGLGGVDRALAAHQLAVVADAPDDAVAVAEPARAAAGRRRAALAAPHLLRQVLEEERVHGALEADVQLADLAFGQGDEGDAGEGQPLVNGGDVLLVARQAIERLGQHDLDAAGLDVAQQPLEAGAPPASNGRCAGDRRVAIDVDEGAALPLDLGAADRNLIVDRRGGLQVRGIAGVDGEGLHGVSGAGH